MALHAIWSATAGIAAYEQRSELHRDTNIVDKVATLAKIIAVPMVLHGLYDTLSKRGSSLPALAVAIGSFGYFALRTAKVAVAPQTATRAEASTS